MNSPQNREDDETSEEAGEAVNGGGDESIAVAVVVELIVAAERQQGAEARAEREEDLGGCVDPYLNETQQYRYSRYKLSLVRGLMDDSFVRSLYFNKLFCLLLIII